MSDSELRSPTSPEDPSRFSRATESVRWLLWPLLAGLALRLWNLRDQILCGDELHALVAVTEASAGELLTRFGRFDYCLPVAALLRFLSDCGLPITEVLVRAPSILAGALAIAALPVWVDRLLGRTTAVFFAWLVAISPWAVLWSRIARSYMPMALFATAAMLCLIDAVDSGRRSGFALGAIFTVLAIWFHLLAAPFVAGAWVAAFVALALRRSSATPAPWRDFVVAGAICTCIVGGIVWAGADSLIDNVTPKIGATDLRIAPWHEVLIYLLGVRHALMATALVFMAAIGFVFACKGTRHLASFFVLPFAVQVGGLWLLAPKDSAAVLVLTRYLFVALPALLMLVALGMTRLVEQRKRFVGVGLVACFALATLLESPLPELLAGHRSFGHVWERFEWLRRSSPGQDRVGAEGEPELLTRARVVALAVRGLKWKSLAAYEQQDALRGKRVIAAVRHRSVENPRFRLRNAVPLALEPVLRSPATVLVADIAKLGEDDQRVADRRSRRGSPQEEMPVVGLLFVEFGQPDLTTSRYAIWNLDRIRSSRSNSLAARSGEERSRSQRRRDSVDSRCNWSKSISGSLLALR